MDWIKVLQPWGEFHPLHPLLGGYRNQAMLFEDHRGMWVGKTTRRSEAALAWLSPVQQAAERAGFVVPQLQKTVDGRYSANHCTLEPLIEGLAVSKAELPGLLPHIRQFHSLTQGFPQRSGFASAVELLSAEKGGDVDLEAMPDEVVERCRHLWKHLADDTPCALHGDLNASNILRTPDGLFALLDWDEARVDSPGFDLWQLQDQKGGLEQQILLAWEVAVCWTVEFEYAHKLARGLG